MPQSVRVEEGAFAARWPLYEALRSRAPVELAGLKTRFGPLPQGTWSERPESAFVLPINAAGLPKPRAFSVTCLSPHRKFDPRYERFLQATAGELAAAMTQARIVEDAAVRARELAELDRAKTLFFSNISHELRTPLTLILGPLEELMANKAEPLDTHALLPIHRNALRLLKRVNDLLDLARFEAGRHEIHKVPTDLAGLTSNLASTFRSLVESAGLQFVVHCEAIKELVLVDRRMWEKIVLNLFTLRGQISVSLNRQGGQLALVVRDTGVGLPEAELPRVFERFHRVAGVSGRSHEGTGIGLALVVELALLHGGKVSVEGTEGEGLTFRVLIPVAEAAVGAAPFVLEASQWLGDMTFEPIAPEPAMQPLEPQASTQASRILVVDDNAGMRADLKRLLPPYFLGGHRLVTGGARLERRDDASPGRPGAASKAPCGPAIQDPARRARLGAHRPGGLHRGPPRRRGRLRLQALQRARAHRPGPHPGPALQGPPGFCRRALASQPRVASSEVGARGVQLLNRPRSARAAGDD